MGKQRLSNIDIAKGIGMLCIVAGHMDVGEINRIVFTFHVPMFFLISGYFISEKKTMAEYVKQKAKRLLVPYLITGGCLILLVQPYIWMCERLNIFVPYTVKSVALAVLYGSGSGGNLMPYGIQQVGVIWFLLALFFSLIFVKWASSRKYAWAIIMGAALLSWWSARHIWLPFSIQSAGTASVFVYIGYLLRKHHVDLSKPKAEIALCGLLAFFVVHHYRVVFYLNSNYFTAGVTGMVAAVFIIYAVLWISYRLEKIESLNMFFSFFGTNSLIFMCVHMIELNYMPWTVLLDYVMPQRSMLCTYIILFAVKVLFSTLGTLLILKIKSFGRPKK